MPFSLFKNAGPEIRVADNVCMNSDGKWNECVRLYNENRDTVFITWFEATQNELVSFFNKKGDLSPKIFLHRQVNRHIIGNAKAIFAEHYPLWRKEQELFSALQLEEAIIFSSLDEPLFLQFGGDKIKNLMEQMGLKPGEMIHHPMITKALKNAQDKLQQKIMIEQSARSQQEWIQKNIK